MWAGFARIDPIWVGRVDRPDADRPDVDRPVASGVVRIEAMRGSTRSGIEPLRMVRIDPIRDGALARIDPIRAGWRIEPIRVGLARIDPMRIDPIRDRADAGPAGADRADPGRTGADRADVDRPDVDRPDVDRPDPGSSRSGSDWCGSSRSRSDWCGSTRCGSNPIRDRADTDRADAGRAGADRIVARIESSRRGAGSPRRVPGGGGSVAVPAPGPWREGGRWASAAPKPPRGCAEVLPGSPRGPGKGPPRRPPAGGVRAPGGGGGCVRRGGCGGRGGGVRRGRCGGRGGWRGCYPPDLQHNGFRFSAVGSSGRPDEEGTGCESRTAHATVIGNARPGPSRFGGTAPTPGGRRGEGGNGRALAAAAARRSFRESGDLPGATNRAISSLGRMVLHATAPLRCLRPPGPPR